MPAASLEMQSVVATARYAGMSVPDALALPYDELTHLSLLRDAEAMAKDLYHRELDSWQKSQRT